MPRREIIRYEPSPRPWGESVVGAARARAAEHVTSRALPIILPWFGMPIVFLAATITHLLWGAPSQLPWTVLLLTIATCGLTTAAWFSTQRRRGIGRWHATITTALTMLWITGATIAGPVSHPTLDLWGILGSALTGSWSLRRGLHADDGIGKLTRLAKRWRGGKNLAGIADTVGLAGSRLQIISQEPDRVEGVLQLRPGHQTPGQVLMSREQMASALQIPAGGVRVTPDPKDHSRALVTFVSRDMLATPTPYPGPSRPGRSVAEPLTIGVYEDARPAHLTLPGLHLLMGGMTGAGKSYGARVILAELWSRADVITWAIDIVKGRQTLGPAMAGLDWVALDRPEAEEMLDCLPDIVTARADHLADRSLDLWEPGCGIPLLVVLIEEAPQLIADSERFIQLSQTARSTGIVLMPSVQRASYNSIPTDARSNFGAAMCYGVKEDRDARFVLGHLVDEGADPAAWGTKRPGCTYLVAPGIPDERQLVPVRTFLMTPAQVVEAAQLAAGRELDAPSVAAGGASYAGRIRGIDVARGKSRARVPVSVPAGPVAEVEQDDPLDSAAEARRLLRAAGITDEDLEPEVDVDPDAPLEPPATPVVFAERKVGRRATPEQARLTLHAQLDEWQRDGRREFAPRDLYDLVARVGRERSWIHDQLNRLIREGRIAQVDEGVYRLRREGEG